MAHDDRDRYLDKALARHFRPSTQGADPAPASVSAGACPDAEVLAAYQDGALSPEERNFWKQHVLACEACQLVLEHLGTPLDVPLAEQIPDLVVAAAASSRQDLRPQASAAAPARVASVTPVSIARSRSRKTYFRWLVPAGAIAAGLLTFAVIRESQYGVKSDKALVEPSAVQPAPAPARPPENLVAESKPEPIVVPPANGERVKDKKENAGAAATRERDEEKRKAPPAPASVGGAASGAAGQPATEAKEAPSEAQLTQQHANARGERVANGPEISAQQQQNQQSMRSAGAAVPRPSAPPPPPQSAFLADENRAERPPAKTPPAAAPQPPGASADTVSSTAETVEGFSSSTRAKVRVAAAQSPLTFGAPGGKLFWRVGPAGSIEQSANAGATWTLQTSGVTTDLRGGSAPTAKVCWVVGNAGTILRSTDGGEHWVKLAAPVSNDLLAVQATDAFRASVWFVADQRSGVLAGYQTSDGGANWSAIPGN